MTGVDQSFVIMRNSEYIYWEQQNMRSSLMQPVFFKEMTPPPLSDPILF